MFEQFSTLRTLFDGIKPVLQKYVSNEKLEAMQREIEQRSTSQRPVLMVYGVYNAGKSTLINALIGQASAPMGDIPETDRVTAYEAGDVTLLDTPGIDAPIEHEKVAREQLARADAVIFVLCTDGVLEEKSTCEEIGHILRAGKSMLIVINNKSGYTPASPEYLALIDKFRNNLYSHFQDDRVVLERLAGVNDYLVNARAALKGKLENKPPLVEHSQLPALEKAVHRLFHDTDSARMASNLAMQLHALLVLAIAQTDHYEQSHEQIQVQELIESVRQSRQNLQQKVMNHAGRSRPALKADLIRLFDEGITTDVNPLISQWQQHQQQYFERQFKLEFEQLNVKVDAVADLFSASPAGAYDASSNEGSAGSASELHKVSIDWKNMMGKVMGDVSRHVPVPEKLVQDTVKTGVLQMLKQGKKWFPEHFKGIGPKSMEKMAGRAAPFIGPALDALRAGWEYHQAHAAQQRLINQETQRREHLSLKVADLVNDLYEDLGESIDTALNAAVKPLLDGLLHQQGELGKSTAGALADKNTFQSVQAVLKRI